MKKENRATIAKVLGWPVVVVTKELAKKHQKEFYQLISLIPGAEYELSDVLREILGKWEHSLAVMRRGKPIAVMFAYERKAENNKLYPKNTLYISEFVVREKDLGQGVGTGLLAVFLKYNERLGFKHLSGKWNVSVQTNADETNRSAKMLYNIWRFAEVGTKQYPNRTDVVMRYPRTPLVEWM